MDRELNILNRQNVEHFRSKLSGYLTKCLIITTVITTIKLKAGMLRRILVISRSLVAIAKYFIVRQESSRTSALFMYVFVYGLDIATITVMNIEKLWCQKYKCYHHQLQSIRV